MKNIGLSLTPANLQFLTLAALALSLTAIATGHDGAPVLGPAAAALLLTTVLTYRSRTALGWAWHRATYRRQRPVNIHLYRHKQLGVTWDGHRASAYIEILPAPYETTLVDGTEFTPVRTIPIDEIRDELVQFDIHTHHATVYTVGYKHDRKSNLASINHAAAGPVDALLYGRTLVEVSIDLSNAIDSLSARKGTGTDAYGLNNTIAVATERIRRRISAAGRPAQLLTDSALAGLDTSLRKTLVPALLDEQWSHAGPATMRALSYSPEPSAWTPEHYRQWCRLGEHRQVHAVRLTPGGGIGDHAEMYVTVLSADSTTLNAAAPSGLRLEHGQQGDILTSYLPSVRTIEPTAIPGRRLLPDRQFPIPLIPGGIGTFLGYTKNRARLFVNFTVGTAPFYLIAPARLCQQLLLRLATSGRSIEIVSEDERWTQFAKRIGATSGSNPEADIVFTTDHAAPQTHPTQVRLVWATNPSTLVRRPDYAIVARRDESELYTPDGVTRYIWAATRAEEPYFTFPDGAGPPQAPKSAASPAGLPPPPPPRPAPPLLPPPPDPAARAKATQAATAAARRSRNVVVAELGRIPEQRPVVQGEGRHARPVERGAVELGTALPAQATD